MGYFVKNMRVGRKPTGPAIPVGDTADRPSDPAVGTIRYNADAGSYEFWNGTNYITLAARGEVGLVVDTFTADGINGTFVMTEDASSASQILVFVGGVYQIPITNYSIVNNNELQFIVPPPVDNLINVIHRLGSTNV
jgi:hypothetical protein